MAIIVDHELAAVDVFPLSEGAANAVGLTISLDSKCNLEKIGVADIQARGLLDGKQSPCAGQVKMPDGSESIMLKFKLDSRKAIEVVAILAGQSPDHKIGRKRLLALLYIANRECLKKSGRPMLGGRLMAMKYGPIHGDVYDLIQNREGADGGPEWSKHFHAEGYNIVLDDDPGKNVLSRFESRILTEVLKRYENDDDWDVALQTHVFTEYKSVFAKGRARTIPLEQIIHAVGLSPMATSIMRDLKEKEELDELFASPKGQPAKYRKSR